MAALYGLLLQVFLVAVHPVPPVVGADGVICAAHDGAPADDGTACPEQLCCLAAHLAQPLAAPGPSAVIAAAPRRLAVAQVWRIAERPPVRGPPDRAVGPRGPPAV